MLSHPSSSDDPISEYLCYGASRPVQISSKDPENSLMQSQNITALWTYNHFSMNYEPMPN